MERIKKEMDEKQIILIIKVMNGGGAERVLSLLANHFFRSGRDVTILLTHQSVSQADFSRVDPHGRVLSVEDQLPAIRHLARMPDHIFSNTC